MQSLIALATVRHLGRPLRMRDRRGFSTTSWSSSCWTNLGHERLDIFRHRNGGKISLTVKGTLIMADRQEPCRPIAFTEETR